MNSLLIHGVYDSQTLMTLKDKGVKLFSFDLRGKSLNLVTFSELQKILKSLSTEKIFLTFENDKKETIDSYLNLLKDTGLSFILIFRDHLDVSYYKQIETSFYWMFHPEGDWKSILSLKNCKGILLPLKFQSEYQNKPELWHLIEKKELDVYLHAETFEETIFITNSQDVNLSVDLSSEVEQSYRKVDQTKLTNLKIWGRPE